MFIRISRDNGPTRAELLIRGTRESITRLARAGPSALDIKPTNLSVSDPERPPCRAIDKNPHTHRALNGTLRSDTPLSRLRSRARPPSHEAGTPTWRCRDTDYWLHARK